MCYKWNISSMRKSWNNEKCTKWKEKVCTSEMICVYERSEITNTNGTWKWFQKKICWYKHWYVQPKNKNKLCQTSHWWNSTITNVQNMWTEETLKTMSKNHLHRWSTKQGTIKLQYNTIQYNTIQYNTIQYNTIQYNSSYAMVSSGIPQVTSEWHFHGIQRESIV